MQKSPSVHHRTICRAISSQLRHVSTIRKKVLNSNISSTRPHNMVTVSPLTSAIGSGVWGTHSKFQRVLHLGFVTAPTSLSGGQPNFARCLAISWAGTQYTVSQKSRTRLLCIITLPKNQRLSIIFHVINRSSTKTLVKHSELRHNLEHDCLVKNVPSILQGKVATLSGVAAC